MHVPIIRCRIISCLWNIFLKYIAFRVFNYSEWFVKTADTLTEFKVALKLVHSNSYYNNIYFLQFVFIKSLILCRNVSEPQ